MNAWIDTHLLSFLVFAPVVLGLLLLVMPDRLAKFAGVLGSSALLVLAAFQLLGLQQEASGLVAMERWFLFNAVGLPVEYHLAVDGLNLWLSLLTLFIVPLAMVGTWDSLKDRAGTAFSLILMIEGGILGAFYAQDLLLFYLFWEGMLLPMYFLIGVWGGTGRKFAANKFLVFTLAGSALWLVALLFLAGKAGSFSPQVMAQAAQDLPFRSQALLLGAFALAFAVKVPMFPLHTWLPDAHVEAPTAGSVILAALLLKLGSYGFLRFAVPIFPGPVVVYAKLLAVLAVAAIIYGALVALVQEDVKKLVAYSSVSHMGLVMLGIASFTEMGIQGAVLQMLNHGISTGALFLLVGMLYDRAHTRDISSFGGVAKRMPVFSFFFILISLSSIGLPLTNGFVGEFLVLNGTFVSSFVWGKWAAVAATLGVLLGAAYMLWMVRKVIWGPENLSEGSGTSRLESDLSTREIAVMVPIVVLVFWIGLHPRTFLGHSEANARNLATSAGAVR